jgi:hypothetical protein
MAQIVIVSTSNDERTFDGEEEWEKLKYEIFSISPVNVRQEGVISNNLYNTEMSSSGQDNSTKKWLVWRSDLPREFSKVRERGSR